jgi:hypothetical protein
MQPEKMSMESGSFKHLGGNDYAFEGVIKNQSDSLMSAPALELSLTFTGLLRVHLKSGLAPFPSRPSRLAPKLQRVPSWVMKVICFYEDERSIISCVMDRCWGVLNDLCEEVDRRLL